MIHFIRLFLLTPDKRVFLMGNALLVGIVEKIGNTLKLFKNNGIIG